MTDSDSALNRLDRCVNSATETTDFAVQPKADFLDRQGTMSDIIGKTVQAGCTCLSISRGSLSAESGVLNEDSLDFDRISPARIGIRLPVLPVV